jgi:hypothetical protein
MKLYRFITNPDNSEFCMRISKLVNKGWKLYGNPTLCFNGTTTIAGQALTKKVKGKKFSKNTDLASY